MRWRKRRTFPPRNGHHGTRNRVARATLSLISIRLSAEASMRTMRTILIGPGLVAPSLVALAVALASSGANAQSVISRSVTVEPVETTVTQTPNGTVVTRRPVAQPPIVQTGPAQAGPAIVERDPRSIDSVTTREVVERAAVTEAMRPVRRTTTRQTSSRSTVRRDARPAPSQATRQVARRTTTTTRTAPRLTARTAPRLALDPRERHIVYQTIIERQVVPGQQVVVTPPVVAQPPLVQRQPPWVQRQVALRPPIVAADDTVGVAEPVYAVGSVLPPNVPLYAMPQNVALGVPAAQSYSYAYLGGRAYLVDPASGTIVADVTE
jgi:Protein of unknown function (DUF1236)